MRAATDHVALIERIYHTVLEPESWPRVLQDICGVIEASSAFLFTPPEFVPIEDGLFVSCGLPGSFEKAVKAQNCGLDAWREAARRRGISRGTLYTGEMLVPERELVQTEHYNVHLRPHDIHSVMGNVLCGPESGEAPISVLSLYRPRQADAFTAADRQAYLRLAPHLRRANDIYWRLRKAELRHRADASLLDRLATGVVLLNAAGEVLHCSAAALRLLHSGDGLEIRKRRLHVLLPDQANKLAKVIGNVCLSQGGGRGDTDAGGFVFIDRPSGGGPWSLLVAPLPRMGWQLTGTNNAVAVVFIHDHRAPASAVNVLGQLYGLTAAEVRLARMLAQGDSLSDIADELGLSKLTLRSQLRSIFNKTGTGRQADLVLLLLTQVVPAK